ncbi:MAG: NAD(+) diphosphatase, partial [Alphaproteobacteria bacterium]|nr:NAD(+) diphosphatase [Alphaproteobacteria bacterium]
LEEFGSFTDLREVGLLMGAEQGSLAAYARGMSHWHKTHKYCGSCGHKTQNLDSGHRRKCSNIACGRDHFPRTDPAVIMLVTDDDDRALLGRSANFKAHTYSTLAGFVEPGESLEQAVQREVFEEVGINCDNVKYHSSQPWPFPSSLMLGFTAHATSLDINVDPEEIEDARWFTREELIAGEASGKYLRPRKDSISWLLISDWLYAKD